MSYNIINAFEWQHVKDRGVTKDELSDYYGIKSPDGYFYVVKVPKRLEKLWSAKKRDKVSNACMDRREGAHNYLYIVTEYDYVKALIKLIMDLG